MVHHGLGLRGDIRQLSVAYLEELILAIEQSAAIRESVSRIQAALCEEQEAASLPRIMDSLLANRKFVLEGKNRDGISRPQTL